MNKKNLSVVMAGAMLATSVAPVLADTTTEVYKVTKGNVGLLIDELDELFASVPKYNKVGDPLYNQSVYGFQLRKVGETKWSKSYNDAIAVVPVEDTTGNGTDNTSELKKVAEDTKNEFEVRVIDRGYREDDDKKIVSTNADSQGYSVYSKEDLNGLANEIGLTSSGKPTVASIDTSSYDTVDSKAGSKSGFAEIDTLFKGDDSADGTNGVLKKVTDLEGNDLKASDNDVTGLKFTLAKADTTVTIKLNDEKLNFNSVKMDDGTVKTAQEAAKATVNAKAVDFEKLNDIVTTTGSDIEEKVLYNLEIVDGDIKVEYKVTDLYDGFMLTTEGHDLLNEINEVKAKKDADKKASPSVTGRYDVTIDKDILNNKFNVTIKTKDTTKVITISATNDDSKKLSTLKTWLEKGKASVDILAGDNRYATAVEIAKTFVANAGQYISESGNLTNTLNDIVMVNGEALVDGLAAAPYAKSLGTHGAPVLLTATDKLPKETKDYLKELLKDKSTTVGGTIATIHIVGGESVVSKSVVNELKDMGFKVDRLAGDNREQTSLEVAKAMKTATDAFVVGAEGEADAMSIAPYAAASKTPIIVAKSATKGLSTMSMNYLDDLTGDVTIIGGEKVVPAENETELVELLGETHVERIAGERRQETNAMIIKKYHNDFSNVLVAKDGTNKKSELVDALPVSIFASANADAVSGKTNAAPVVLATNKLSDSQINNIVLNSEVNKADGTVYQIGGGVSRSVMEKIVTKLGLNN